MSKKLNVLIIEDSEDDAFLILHELQRAGYELISERVDTSEAMNAALAGQTWDIILSDYVMPQFNGAEALELRNDKKPGVPFILVSGKIDEETAIEMIKKGAGNYIMKDNLARLVPAVKRELSAAKLRLNRKGAETALRESEKRFRTLFEYASDAICLIDRKTKRLLDCNRKASEITQCTASQLKNSHITDILAHEAPNVISRVFNKIEEHGALDGISGLSLLRRDCALVPVDISATMISTFEQQYYLFIMRDISERIKAERALRESEEKYRALFKNMFIGCALHKIIMNEDGSPVDYMFLEINAAFEKITGLKSGNIIGRKVSEVASGIKPDLLSLYSKVAATGDQTRFELQFKSSNEWYSVAAYSPMKGYLVTLFDDITAQKNTERRLKSVAITDDLTGLFNRRGFFSLAEHQIRLAKGSGKSPALLYLDLDELKQINDRFGHSEGDRALKDMAGLLKDTFRESDIVARLSGDEFAVLLTDSSPDAKDVIPKYLQGVLTEFNSKEHRKYKLSVSMGTAFFDPESPYSLGALLLKADNMMYREKGKHKNGQEIIKANGLNMERRKYDRHDLDHEHVAMIDDSLMASIKDISHGGMCLVTLRQLPVDTEHEIILEFPENNTFKASAATVWSSINNKSRKPSMRLPYESGLKFISLSDHERKLLDSVIRQNVM